MKRENALKGDMLSGPMKGELSGPMKGELRQPNEGRSVCHFSIESAPTGNRSYHRIDSTYRISPFPQIREPRIMGWGKELSAPLRIHSPEGNVSMHATGGESKEEEKEKRGVQE
jgi:hypothetical protein